jgi:hypothetical protein
MHIIIAAARQAGGRISGLPLGAAGPETTDDEKEAVRNEAVERKSEAIADAAMEFFE